MTEINAPMDVFDVYGRDGTRLKAYRAGRGPHRWLLPPGLGTPILCWKYLFDLMHEQIRDSELFLVPDGTHYTTIEYPEIVNLKLEQFFRRRVFGKGF